MQRIQGLSDIYDSYLGGIQAKQGYQIFIMFAIHKQHRHVFQGNFVRAQDTRLSDIYDGYLGGIEAKQGYQIFIMFAIHRQHRHLYEGSFVHAKDKKLSRGHRTWLPSNRVISSPFSHKTFFFTKLCEGTP